MSSYSSFYEISPIANNVVRSTAPGFSGSFGPATLDSGILGGPLSATGSHYMVGNCSTIIMDNTNKIPAFAGSILGSYNSIANGIKPHPPTASQA